MTKDADLPRDAVSQQVRILKRPRHKKASKRQTHAERQGVAATVDFQSVDVNYIGRDIYDIEVLIMKLTQVVTQLYVYAEILCQHYRITYAQVKHHAARERVAVTAAYRIAQIGERIQPLILDKLVAAGGKNGSRAVTQTFVPV